MKYAMVLVLVCVAACQTRSPTKGTRRADSLDLAALTHEDSSEDALLVPRTIAEPTVVVFWLRATDTLSVADQAEVFDDLKYYTGQVVPALEASGIRLLATNAETVYVALPNRQRRAILLSGLDYPFGYLLVDPGGPERILSGVYPEDQLLEELRAYFDLPEDTTTARPRITT
ncbi:MAG: hypothetical protein ACREMM_04790 [Gemmatimonadales bacterium]